MSFHAKWANFFQKLNQVFCIEMKIWHICRSHWKIKNAKKILENYYLWCYDHF